MKTMSEIFRGSGARISLVLIVAGLLQFFACFDSLRVSQYQSWKTGATPEMLAAGVPVDLDSIIRRDTLRVITLSSPATYFLYRGRELGFEHELAQRFARTTGVHIQMIVARDASQVVPWLMEGRGDIVALGFSTDLSCNYDAHACSPYGATRMVVVTGRNGASIDSLSDLAGRSVHVRGGSRAYHALTGFNHQLGGAITIHAMPGSWDNESALSAVAYGSVEITVADWPLVAMELQHHKGLRIGPELGTPDSVAWLVRPTSVKLATAVNAFLDQARGSAFFNMLKKRYFEQETRYSRYRTEFVRFRRTGRLTPYDQLIRDAAGNHGLDWALVAAQMYQESRFNARARSWAGAVGLMQLMPETAKMMGVRNIRDAKQNIDAGTRYLALHVVRFDSLTERNALAFALASYNAGLGHVLDARKIARDEGLNPDVWKDNVELTIRKLARERYYRNATYGYCRGSETANYVNGILGRWQVYQEMLAYQQQAFVL